MAKMNLFIFNFNSLKKFISKILLFTILLFLIIIALNKSVPFYWANDVLEKKINHLLYSSSQDYNTFFVGSSLVYRHINPIKFDSITNCKSFNLGSPGTEYLEANYILENFLKRYSSKDSINVFLQSTGLPKINDKDLHSVRTKYFLDLKRTGWAVKYWISKSPKNYKQIHNYLMSYIENILCIGKIKDILKFHFNHPNTINNIVIAQNGFYALDQELKLDNDKSLLNRNNKYKLLKNKNKPKRNSKKVGLRKVKAGAVNNLPGKEHTNYYKIGKLKLKEEYFFDRYHFNEKGANYYSTKIGDSFLNFRNGCK